MFWNKKNKPAENTLRLNHINPYYVLVHENEIITISFSVHKENIKLSKFGWYTTKSYTEGSFPLYGDYSWWNTWTILLAENVKAYSFSDLDFVPNENITASHYTWLMGLNNVRKRFTDTMCRLSLKKETLPLANKMQQFLNERRESFFVNLTEEEKQLLKKNGIVPFTQVSSYSSAR